MEQRLKNRLVGATVIVAAVVILVPEYFDDEAGTEGSSLAVEDGRDGEFSSRIVPLEADVAEEVVEVTPDLEIIEDRPPSTVVQNAAVPPAGEVQPRTEGALSVPIPIPKPSQQVHSESERLGLTVWAVQLGSFSKGPNALALRDQLREQGYAAFVQTVVGEQGSVTRVYVGPELFREQAETIRKKLASEMTLNAMVVRYPGG